MIEYIYLNLIYIHYWPIPLYHNALLQCLVSWRLDFHVPFFFFHISFWAISPILSLSLTDTFPSCDALPLFKNVAQRRPHERLQHVRLKPKGWRKIPTVLTRVPSARWLPPQGVPAWAEQRGEKNDPLLDIYNGVEGNRDTKTKEVNVPVIPPRPLSLACHNLGSSHGLDSPGLTEACRSEGRQVCAANTSA